MPGRLSRRCLRCPISTSWQMAGKSFKRLLWLLLILCDKSIPDPFLGLNELDVEWVGEKSWTYRTTFAAPDGAATSSVYLLFQGLDTFAKVTLNGTVVLESDNMFLSHRVDITKVVKDSNTLFIDFDSAPLRGRALEKEHSDYRFIAHNGETGRLAVRKAQYHWVSLLTVPLGRRL